MTTQNIIVQGMVCKYCKKSIETMISRMKGISEVEADVRKGTVKVSGEMINLTNIKSQLESIGYVYGGIV